MSISSFSKFIFNPGLSSSIILDVDVLHMRDYAQRQSAQREQLLVYTNVLSGFNIHPPLYWVSLIFVSSIMLVDLSLGSQISQLKFKISTRLRRYG